MLFGEPVSAGLLSVAPVSFVPTQACAGLFRASKTVRVIVPPGVTARFWRKLMS
jgi:hypothetical protein